MFRSTAQLRAQSRTGLPVGSIEAICDGGVGFHAVGKAGYTAVYLEIQSSSVLLLMSWYIRGRDEPSISLAGHHTRTCRADAVPSNNYDYLPEFQNGDRSWLPLVCSDIYKATRNTRYSQVLIYHSVHSKALRILLVNAHRRCQHQLWRAPLLSLSKQATISPQQDIWNGRAHSP